MSSEGPLALVGDPRLNDGGHTSYQNISEFCTEMYNLTLMPLLAAAS